MRYTVKAAARFLGLSPNSVRRYAPIYGIGEKFGNAWLFTDADLEVIRQHMRRGRGRPKGGESI